MTVHLNKNQLFVFSLFCFAGSWYLFILIIKDGFQTLHKHGSSSFLFGINDFFTQTPPSVREERLNHLNNYCCSEEAKIHRLKSKDRYLFGAVGAYYFLKDYNVTFCKVPKVGSTFMMELFEILTIGNSSVDKSRLSVHTRTGDSRLNRTNIWHTVSAARNPYSRLFSAYVDKILLPNIYQTSKIIQIFLMNGSHVSPDAVIDDVCVYGITFEQFLQYVVRTARSPEYMNRHWAPVSRLCNMCGNLNHMIIKQETFTQDIEDLLESLNVSNDVQDEVKNLMEGKRIESTIPGIVEVVLSRRDTFNNCISDMELLEKLWVSFQIQGYISENRTFPYEQLKTIPSKGLSEFYSRFILDQINMVYFPKEDSKAQRNRFLSKAYKTVSKDTLDEIKRIYMADFRMFDYSMEPP